jgi:hypothetical protein
MVDASDATVGVVKIVWLEGSPFGCCCAVVVVVMMG